MHQIYSNNLEKEEQIALVYMQNQGQENPCKKQTFLSRFKNFKFIDYLSSLKQHKNIFCKFEKSDSLLLIPIKESVLIGIGTVLKLNSINYNLLYFLGLYNLEIGFSLFKEGPFRYDKPFTGEKKFHLPFVLRSLLGFSFLKFIVFNKEINIGVRKYTVYNTGILDHRYLEDFNLILNPLGCGDIYHLYLSSKFDHFKVLFGVSVLTEINFLHAFIHLFIKKITCNYRCKRSMFLEINFSFFN